MRVNRFCIETLSCSLLISSLGYCSMLLADELPSLDFLEYLGSEESQVDDRWTSPVDLDIENYLVANQPRPTAPDTSEDDKYE